jgi:hypothetical protein
MGGRVEIWGGGRVGESTRVEEAFKYIYVRGSG